MFKRGGKQNREMQMSKKIKYSAFTLMELIVSIGIIAILSAGLFTVGSYIDTQMKIKRTQATIQLLVTALEQYHDFIHSFPGQNANLYNELTRFPESKKIVDQIERKAIKKTSSSIDFYDSWNNKLIYDYKDGWNFPVITSTGKDPNNAGDDITSKGM
jgi:prepilin-type N-terminal cleavage/methylation domain-containing protein